jgi:hypothetical protein
VEFPLEHATLRIGGSDQTRARGVKILDLDAQTLDRFSMHLRNELSVMAIRASRGQAPLDVDVLARGDTQATTLGGRTGTS